MLPSPAKGLLYHFQNGKEEPEGPKNGRKCTNKPDGLEIGHVLAISRNLNAKNNPLREASLFGRRQGIIYNPAHPKTNYINEPLRTRDSPIYGRTGPFARRYDDMRLPTPVLPDERYGLLMVFRVFDRASYAIVLEADRQVSVLDLVANP